MARITAIETTLPIAMTQVSDARHPVMRSSTTRKKKKKKSSRRSMIR